MAANYLYPGQMAMVYVEELNKLVPYFELYEEIPDDYSGHGAVNSANYPESGGYLSHEAVYVRQQTGAYPGAPIITPAVLIALFVMIAIVAIAIAIIVAIYAMQAYEEVPDTVPTTCANGSTCYSSSILMGVCWYRKDCCTGKVTKADAGCDPNPAKWVNYLFMAVIVGVGGYAAIKILNALPKKKGK